MNCTKCGKEMSSAFCPHCGAPAGDAPCPKCGHAHSHAFCPQCGTAAAARATAPAARPLAARDRRAITPEKVVCIMIGLLFLMGGLFLNSYASKTIETLDSSPNWTILSQRTEEEQRAYTQAQNNRSMGTILISAGALFLCYEVLSVFLLSAENPAPNTKSSALGADSLRGGLVGGAAVAISTVLDFRISIGTIPGTGLSADVMLSYALAAFFGVTFGPVAGAVAGGIGGLAGVLMWPKFALFPMGIFGAIIVAIMGFSFGVLFRSFGVQNGRFGDAGASRLIAGSFVLYLSAAIVKMAPLYLTVYRRIDGVAPSHIVINELAQGLLNFITTSIFGIILLSIYAKIRRGTVARRQPGGNR